MEKTHKICFLGYRELSEAANKVIASLNYTDTDVMLLECNVDTLSLAVDRAISEGYEVFVTRLANAAEFRRYSTARLVEIQLSMVDYLIAIRKALTLGDRPVIAAYRFSEPLDLPLLEELAGTRLEVISYEDSSDLRDSILASSGNVIIGASHAVETANELNRKCILLQTNEESIRSAIQRARRLCIELNKDIRRVKTFQAILSHAPIGLIVNDIDGRITIFNHAAREYTGIGNAKLLGMRIADVFPTLAPEPFLSSSRKQDEHRRLINGAMIRCTQTLIESAQRPIGILTTLFPNNVRRKQSDQQKASPFTAHATWKDVISRSPIMRSLIQQANTTASSDYPLIIEGETGTGKSFFAQCIHNGSTRAKEPYVPIHTPSIPDREAGKILFGYEDAQGVHPGLLELSGKGTVVLQSLPLASGVVQECLLQAISQRKFLRQGGTQPVNFHARIITPLPNSGDVGSISSELWIKLSVLRLMIPPLRERKDDIADLFSFYAAQESGISRKVTLSVPAELLQAYSWPGNLTELSTVCKRYAFALAQGGDSSPKARYLTLVQAIGEDRLLDEIRREYPALTAPTKASPAELQRGIARIKQLLKYNNNKVAEKLSLSRTTLWRLEKAAAGAENDTDG